MDMPETDMFGNPIIEKPRRSAVKEPKPEPVHEPPPPSERVQQAQALETFFLSGGAITAVEALETMGIASFHRRVSDLKEKGLVIVSSWIEVKTRYGSGVTKVKQYKLHTDETGETQCPQEA